VHVDTVVEMRLWSLVALLLVAVVYAGGCLGNGGGEGFSLQISSEHGSHAIEGWSAMTASVEATFLLNGSRNVTTVKMFPILLIKTSDDVKNLSSAFPLGDGVYEIPPYEWTSQGGDKKFTSVMATFANNTTSLITITMRGDPVGTLNARIYFRVRRLENGSYLVAGIGAFPGVFGAFGKEYSLVMKPSSMSMQVEGMPPAKYLGNWTYLLPPTNSLESGGTKTIIDYPVALVYLKSGNKEAFVGKIYFPYEKIKKETG